MKYRVYDIDYDTDGETVDVPTEMVIELGEDAEPSIDLGDKISDKTGWCVNGFQFHRIEDSPPLASDGAE
jgi:hypothetical protein